MSGIQQACCAPLTISTAVRNTSIGHSASTSAVVERSDGVECPHRGQHRSRIGAGVSQHRRRGDRQLGHRPAVGQVAEVDDPVGLSGACLATRDTTTFASVRSRCTACRGSSSASGAIRDQASRAAVSSRSRSDGSATCEISCRHNVGAVAQIPLQDPVQAGMAEAAPAPGSPGPPPRRGPRPPTATGSPTPAAFRRAGSAAAAHRRFRRPNPLWPCTSRPRHSAWARRRAGIGSASAISSRRQVLGFQFGCGERRIGDLEHPDDLAGGVGDHEVLVLVAAQRRRLRAHAVVRGAESPRPAPRSPEAPEAPAPQGN